MKFENWCATLMSLFFAFSALTMAFAQIKSAEATDLALYSLIQYENSRIISDQEIKTMILKTDSFVNDNSKRLNTNYACLATILAERMEPFNRTLYDKLFSYCIPKNFSIENISFGTLENFDPSKPISSLNEKLSEIGYLKVWAVWFQGASVLFFILGVACLIFLVEKKVIDFSFGKKEIIEESLK